MLKKFLDSFLKTDEAKKLAASVAEVLKIINDTHSQVKANGVMLQKILENQEQLSKQRGK